VLVTLLKRPLLKHATPRAPTQCTDPEEEFASKDLEEEVSLAIIALARLMECGVLQPWMRLRGVQAALTRVVSHPAPPPLVWQETWQRFTGPESGNIDWKLSIHFHRSWSLSCSCSSCVCCSAAYCIVLTRVEVTRVAFDIAQYGIPCPLSHALCGMPAIVGCILTP
jgi:hypothetical protein